VSITVRLAPRRGLSPSILGALAPAARAERVLLLLPPLLRDDVCSALL
jgi:hypothetical protein